MLERNIIQPSKSDFACRVTLAPKGESYRFCVDYSLMNRKIKRDRFPLVNPEDIFSSLCFATVFSTLDLKSRYH